MSKIIKILCVTAICVSLSSCEKKTVPVTVAVKGSLVDSSGSEFKDNFEAWLNVHVDYTINGTAHTARVVGQKIQIKDNSDLDLNVKTNIEYVKSVLSKEKNVEFKDYRVSLQLSHSISVAAEYPEGKPSLASLNDSPAKVRFRLSAVQVAVARGINHALSIYTSEERDSALRILANENAQDIDVDLCLAISNATLSTSSREAIITDFAYRRAKELSGSDFNKLANSIYTTSIRNEILRLAVQYSNK